MTEHQNFLKCGSIDFVLSEKATGSLNERELHFFLKRHQIFKRENTTFFFLIKEAPDF